MSTSARVHVLPSSDTTRMIQTEDNRIKGGKKELAFSPGTADKLFGRKGLANECIPC